MPSPPYMLHPTSGPVYSPPAFERDLPASSFRPFDDVPSPGLSSIPMDTSVEYDLTAVSETVRPAMQAFSSERSGSSSSRHPPGTPLSSSNTFTTRRQVLPKPFIPHNGDLLGTSSESASHSPGNSRIDIRAVHTSQETGSDVTQLAQALSSPYVSQMDPTEVASSSQDYASDTPTSSQVSTNNHHAPLPGQGPIHQDQSQPVTHRRQPSEPDFSGQQSRASSAPYRYNDSSPSQSPGPYPYPHPGERYSTRMPYAHPFAYTQQVQYAGASLAFGHSTQYSSDWSPSSGYPYHLSAPSEYPAPQSPPVRNQQRHGSSSVRIGAQPPPTPVPSYEEPLNGSGLHTLLLTYGLTGPHLEQTSQPPISSMSSALNATTFEASPVLPMSQVVPADDPEVAETTVPSVPSVPPPRRSERHTRTPPRVGSLDNDNIDFSPRIGARGRETSGGSVVAGSEVARGSNEIRPRSQFVAHRLGRLDALRTQYARASPTASANGERTDRTSWLEHGWDLGSSASGASARWSSEAADTSSRQGRFGLDEVRDLRSRPGRRLRSLEEIEAQDRDIGEEITNWNQEIIDSMGRRVSGDRTQSPVTALRRLHNLYALDANVAQDQLDQNDTFRSHGQNNRPWPTLWGSIPIDTSTTNASEQSHQMHLPMMYSGWDPSVSAARLASARQAQMTITVERQTEDYTMFASQEAPRERLHGRHGVVGGVPGSYFDFFETTAHYDALGHLQLTPQMTEAEKAKALKSLVKSVDRLPTTLRKKLAEDTVQCKAYNEIGFTEELQRDTYCSVCHDDVGLPY